MVAIMQLTQQLAVGSWHSNRYTASVEVITRGPAQPLEMETEPSSVQPCSFTRFTCAAHNQLQQVLTRTARQKVLYL
jgi:hypothetical protein